MCVNGSCIKVEFAVDENDPKKPKLRNLGEKDGFDKSVTIIWEDYESYTVDLASFLTDDSDKNNIEWSYLFPLDSSQFCYGCYEPKPNPNEMVKYRISACPKGYAFGEPLPEDVCDNLTLVIVPRSTWNRSHRCKEGADRSDNQWKPCEKDDPEDEFEWWCPKEADAGMAACEINKSDPTCWLNELPALYSRIDIVNGVPEDPEPTNCCPQLITQLWARATCLTSYYHPGASFEMRSQPTPGGHGHQTTYDNNGQLIRSGLAAGSADMSHWTYLIGENSHSACDVLPFLWAAQLDANPVQCDTVKDECTSPDIALECLNLTAPLMHEGENLKKFLRDRPTLANDNDESELVPNYCGFGVQCPPETLCIGDRCVLF